MGCGYKVGFIILAFILCPYNYVWAEDEEEEGVTGVATPNGVWDTSISFGEESLEDYLPEEETDERIKARRFNTSYTTDERNDVPYKIGIIGYDRDYEIQDLDNKTLSFTTKIGKSIPERNKNPITQNATVDFRRKRSFYKTKY